MHDQADVTIDMRTPTPTPTPSPVSTNNVPAPILAPTPPTKPPAENRISSGIIVGAVLGSVLLCIFLCGLLFWLLRRRKRSLADSQPDRHRNVYATPALEKSAAVAYTEVNTGAAPNVRAVQYDADTYPLPAPVSALRHNRRPSFDTFEDLKLRFARDEFNDR